MPPTLARGQNPVPNRVLSVSHFNRAEVGHFCLAPREDASADHNPSAMDTLATGVLANDCAFVARLPNHKMAEDKTDWTILCGPQLKQ